MRFRSVSRQARIPSQWFKRCSHGWKRSKQTLPNDINIAIRQNQATFIERSIDDIQHHLIYGSLLASLVVFFFLRNLRSTIIAALAIPVSLIGTFIVMKIFGLTLNNMTLLALSLATGIVIDDAIVVLENIFRYVEEKGVSPRQAASEATAEIGLAVLATTLSLVVIFLPVVFITGQIGQYLLAFGIASATAILLSMFVSFTLTPALCAMWLRPQDAGGDGHQSKKAGIYARVDTRLRPHAGVEPSSSVCDADRWRRRSVLSAVLLLPRIGTELVPEDDQSEFNVSVNLPRGTTLDRTAEYVKDIEPMLLATDNVQTVFTNIQPNQGELSRRSDTSRGPGCFPAGHDPRGAFQAAEKVPIPARASMFQAARLFRAHRRQAAATTGAEAAVITATACRCSCRDRTSTNCSST